MKIHIVQKGDTLWNLSKQYNVDFQALKAANSQLANPDMIMPGMKIKIPVAKKHVSQPKMAAAPKQKTITPYKQLPQKAQPVAEEPVALPQPNMMWVPCLPCSMMPYPPQAYYNLCDAYQDPSKLQQNCYDQNYQWQLQATQPYNYTQNQKWGELDVNDQPDDNDNQQLTNQLNYNPYYMPYQTQWPTQQMGYPSYPYNYQGYQNYANYAPRNDQSEGNDDN